MNNRPVRLFFALAAGKAVAVPLNFATTVLVGWLLGPRGLGEWALLAAAGTLLHTALVNWTHPSTVRFGHQEWLTTHGLNRTLGARLPLLGLGFAIACGFVVLEPAQWMQRWFAVERSDFWMVAVFALSVWLAAEAQASLQAMDRIHWQAALAPLVGLMSAAALVVLLWLGYRSLQSVVIATTLFPIVVWGNAWLFSLAQSSTRVERLELSAFGRNLRYAAPLIPTFAVAYVANWGDHVLLRSFSSVAEVGLFGISYQMMMTILAANGLLTTLMLPRLISSEAAAAGAVRKYVEEEVPTLFALWMMAMVWIVALVPISVALVTGPEFTRSVELLPVLLIAVPSSVVTSLYTVLFNMQERMGRMFLYSLLMAMTNVIVSVALIPAYGAVGAGVGTAASYGVSQALYVWDQHQALAVPALQVWTLWAAGLALGVVQYVIGARTPSRLLWAVGATAVLIGIVRTVRCVDGRLVDRLFAGRLRSVGGIINRALVAKPY